MTPLIRTLSLALAICGIGSSLHAQAAPPAPKRDSVRVLPAPYTPPPPPAPARTAVSQRAVRSTEAAPTAVPAPPARVGVPVDSARPAARSVRAQTAPEGTTKNAPPPPPTPRRTAQVVAEPVSVDGPPPAGATARCKDGTYLFTTANEHSCDNRGGLVVLITPKPAPPTPPRRP